MAIDRQTRQQHYRYRMACEPFSETLWCFLACDLAHGKRVISDDGIPDQADIGLRGSRLLIRPGIPQEIPVELLPAAVKIVDLVIGAELFNPSFRAHRFDPGSKNPGSFSRRSRRGRGRGGASSAVTKAFHCAAL